MILVDVQLALRAVTVEDRVPELNMCDEPSNALPTEFSTGLYFIWDIKSASLSHQVSLFLISKMRSGIKLA